MILTLILRECGSVQIKLASTTLTCRSLNFFRQSANNSRDSGAATCQVVGGSSHRLQSRQKFTMASRWIPCDISTVSLMQSRHSVPSSEGAPQRQQRTLDGISQCLALPDNEGAPVYLGIVRLVSAIDTGASSSMSVSILKDCDCEWCDNCWVMLFLQVQVQNIFPPRRGEVQSWWGELPPNIDRLTKRPFAFSFSSS